MGKRERRRWLRGLLGTCGSRTGGAVFSQRGIQSGTRPGSGKQAAAGGCSAPQLCGLLCLLKEFTHRHLAYLEEHYGVQIDEERFTVSYVVFGSNLMPDITVLEQGS